MSVKVDTRAPVLSATPRSALVDEPFAITVENVAPGARVSIRSRLVDDTGVTWSAAATFRADDRGRVDLRRDAPEPGGSYEGVEPMGLMWSLRAEGDGPGNPLHFRRSLDPLELRIEVAAESGATATATLERLSIAPGVRRTEVRDRGLVGSFAVELRTIGEGVELALQDLQRILDEHELRTSQPGLGGNAVLDFSSVRFINSSNISRLLRLRKRAVTGDLKLILCGISTQLWGTFLSTGLDKVFEFSDNVTTALATLQISSDQSAR